MNKSKNDLNKIKKKINSTLKYFEKNKSLDKKILENFINDINEMQKRTSLQQENFFRTTLYSIGDGVITTDLNGKIQQMNPVAEKLCGWKESEAKNKSFESVFKIIAEITKVKSENPVKRVLKSKHTVGLANHTLLISKTGKKIPIADSSSPIKNDKGKIIGVIIVFRDQTREREKENTLEERERKYSTLVSNLPGFIYQCKNDKDWTMEFISDGCKKITGYTPSDFIKNNKIAFNDIIHPDYKKTIWNKWQKILKERTYFEFEYPIIAKNGKLKWIWERGRGVYSTNGKLIFLEGFIEDISERRNAEESLRLKNIVFESSITANSIANLEGKLIDANAAFLNFWGYKSKSKVLGKSLNVFIKSKNDVVKILSTLNKKGVWEGDFLAKRSDRSEFIAHGLATTVVDNKGKIIGYQSSVLDVTDRNRTEALLKESENRYKIFFDNSPDAIFLADPESGEIVNANKAALQLLKMSYSKVVGMHQSQLHPKRLEDHAVKGFEEHKKKNELIKPIENYVLTASGEEIPVEVLASTLKINGKTVIQGVFRNISERRRIEKALKESENKFQLFFEHSKDAMLLLDGNVFFDCNNAAVEMLGYNNKSEMLSAHPSKLSPDFQPDGTASFTKAEKIMNQAYKDGFVRFEWTHRKMNGEDLPVEVMLTSIPLAGKQILFTVWRDITERKTIESEIQRSRERMQLLVEGTPHLFFYVQNLDGKIEYISPSVENITGYSVSEWHNQNTWFITDSPINQNARKRTWEHLSGIINNDPVYAEILHANGSKVMIEIYERPIIKEGKVLGLHGVAHDISERIRFEQNLKESEISYRGLFNSVSEAIYILDENGIFIDINEGALEMYGYGRNELIGKTPEFVSAPNKNDLSSVAAALGKAFEGEKQQFEFWGKRKNGEEFLKDVRLYLGTYLNKKVCIAIANDITEKRKAEELLRESEKRYKLIAENTADSIAIFDLNLNYTYISPSVINLLGYSPEELMSLGLVNIISEDAKNIIQKVLLEELENEINRNADPHRSRIIETEQLRKDGSKIWVEGTVSFLRDDNGNPIGILAVSRDVSSRKLVEAALASSEERYRAISTLTSDYLFSTLINDQGIHELVWIAGSFEKITGYTFEEYKRIGGWRATLHPSELELDNLDLDALNRNEKVNREIKTYHKNGSLVWVRSHAQPIWDFKYNKLIGVYGAVEDITHRKQTEIIQKIQYNIADAVVTYKTLTELFEIIRIELSALINVNNFFIALYDEKTGMLSSDVDKDEIEEIETWPAKGSMTGYVIEQKKSILLTKSEILQLINTGTAGMIGVIPEIWLGVPFKVSGKVIGVLVVQSYDNPYAYNLGSMEVLEIVAHELSIYIQHKKAESETLKLSAAIVQSPTIVVITDPTGNIEYANPKFSEITGYSLEEAKGNNPKILKSGKHKNEFYTGLWKTILSGKTWHGEFQNKKKNGELYWENALIAPLIDSDGNITNFVAVKEDITEKKKMIEELIIAKEKAEEMNRIKSSFFANMSHELRTPMVGILGFSEVLMSELKDNPDYLHMISSINTSGQRLLETLNLILNLSKLEASKVVANLKTQDIIPILKESFGFFKSAADKKGLLGSVLFLSQRGLAAGFTIYAPALILSVILGWELNITIVLIGIMVIIYTSIGGTNAVNKTHVLQMIIITVGMFASFFMIYILLPKDISVIDAAFIAGKLGKLNAIDFSFNLNDRYTFWSGIIGGTFLMLSYFGTDQSQVARYLAAKNITQSRMGLLVNGLVKIPMQFIILFIGAMVFVFFQFVTPPLFFNPVETEKVKSSSYSNEYSILENDFEILQNQKREKLRAMLDESSRSGLSSNENIKNELTKISKNEQVIKTNAKEIIKKNNPDADTNDTNYIFITYIVNYLPIGLIGLLLAAIIAASMSSTSAELNSLASTSLIDIYKRLINKNGSDNHYLKFSKYATVGWGIYAIIFALLASELGSLIEAVNILGSLVYGTILGIFLVAFYTKKISGDSVFISAVVAEAVVIYSFVFTSIPFLWYNVIGCAIVIVLSFIINPILPSKENR